ncbi:MAG: hypothetical protein LBB81_04945 [Treponema sp.]|jgi:hypothetical protein|nr:hypothetical protein [Treponema sp.]
MKKFIITLFILIVLGGAGFLIGWVQLSVPHGSYGIINSKTHGVDPQVVQSGEFRWVWYKLIPTNVQINVFKTENVKSTMDFNSSLPSGENYAEFAGLTAKEFSWNLSGEISFNIDPDKLVSIVYKNNITDQEGLDAYIQDIIRNIKTIILRTLTSVDTDSERLERIMAGSHDAQIEQEIKNRFPEIRDFSFVIISAVFPDFILYRQVRLLYEEFLAMQREYVTSGFAQRAQTHIETQLRFGELERYGELLTKYPILMEYLAMTMGKEE